MLPALAENASALRRAVDDWARAVRLPPELVEAVSLAVYEAMANAVEHAYHGREPGALRVHAVITGPPGDAGTLVVRIEDDGEWLRPGSVDGLRGRGIPLMEALAGVVEIAATPDGTTVTLSWPVDGFVG
ncbi:Anti-sigma regulatory factor (Ser/Thr protein kinase) [Amycolatopsis sacchari]|uniref:Anti-sigma regulatory factor (Ser/Thr protein kinase) n=1 Tax=Amycolatopsis sacchari TaxID=115433 RepID=A0A1I3KB36_9PSEU|nr:ATP-binding protein [Amycolatopsis sacchari]SFI69415.1 Anti-sigma regulatory factor (Ser/Thr protein kinase) [Amycolatopsis sacchari]